MLLARDDDHRVPGDQSRSHDDTRPSSAESWGATIATTPGRLRHGDVEVRTRDGVRVTRHLGVLVAPSGVPDPEIDASSTCEPRPPPRRLLRRDLLDELRTTPSSTSATRYRTCPRCRRSHPDQPLTAARAATTASRASLREPFAAFARKAPLGVSTSYVRPDSLRGKAPPIASLYVLGTVSRLLMLRSLEVGGETLAAALAAEPGLLVAAERARRVEAVEGVGPDDTGTQAVGHSEDTRSLVGPDACGQAVRRVVRLRDGLGGVRKVSTESTGPKTSSRAMRCDASTPVKIVGANQKPCSGIAQSALQRSAPSLPRCR